MFEKPLNPYQSLKLTAECPVCRKKQFPADIKLIEEREEWQMLHVRCRQCGTNILVAVSLGDQGMNLVGVLTDLRSEEVAGFLDSEAVNTDDVLAVYERLRAGDLASRILATKEK